MFIVARIALPSVSWTRRRCRTSIAVQLKLSSAYTSIMTHRSVCLVKHGRSQGPDDRHDQHCTGHPGRFRVELLLLALEGAGTHTRSGHEQHSSQDTPHDRPLDQSPFALGESDTVEDNLNDRTKSRIDHCTHTNRRLSRDGRHGHPDKVTERNDRRETKDKDECLGGDQGQQW